MRKFSIYLLFVAVAVVIISIYGVVHHQLTFSAGPEYYTKFKFIQTNLADTLAARHMTQPRSAVVIAAVKTSYPVGLAIGILIGLIALILPPDTVFPSALQALGLTLLISVGMALFCYYSTSNAHMGSGVYDPLPTRLPDNLVNKQAFLKAASIQYGALLGYVVGGAAAIIFLIVKNGRVRRRLADNDIPSGGA